MRYEAQYKFRVGDRVECRPGAVVFTGVVTGRQYVEESGGQSTEGECHQLSGRDIIERPMYRVKLDNPDDPEVAAMQQNIWSERDLRAPDLPMSNVLKGYKGESHMDGGYYWDPLKGWVRYTDQPLVGHTSNPEYEKLKQDPMMEALRDRTVKVELPPDLRA